MKNILVLRHAKSDWSNPEYEDFDRPLNSRGERDAPRMGEAIKMLQIIPERIFSSTAKRAVTTTQIVANNCGYDKNIDYLDDLYPGDIHTILRYLKDTPAYVETVMIVGHNPAMEEFVSNMVADGYTNLCMPTTSLAVLHADVEEWDKVGFGTAQMYWLINPKLLRRLFNQ